MNTKRFLILLAGLGLLGLALLAGQLPAQAAPAAQLTVFPTPTPGPDGRIIYIVQKGDTLWRIAAISGLTVEKLLALNHFSADVILNEGDQILLGLAGPALITITPGPSPTPLPATPTPTYQPGVGELCVMLYLDSNGDSLRQEEEPSIPGGAISVANRSGTVSYTSETPGGLDVEQEAQRADVCFKDLPEGEYTISVAHPEGYNATTQMNRTLEIKAGDKSYASFGAQPNSVKATEIVVIPSVPVIEAPPEPSPLLGIAGAVIIVIGLLLGVYAWIIRKAGG